MRLAIIDVLIIAGYVKDHFFFTWLFFSLTFLFSLDYFFHWLFFFLDEIFFACQSLEKTLTILLSATCNKCWRFFRGRNYSSLSATFQGHCSFRIQKISTLNFWAPIFFDIISLNFFQISDRHQNENWISQFSPLTYIFEKHEVFIEFWTLYQRHASAEKAMP